MYHVSMATATKTPEEIIERQKVEIKDLIAKVDALEEILRDTTSNAPPYSLKPISVERDDGGNVIKTSTCSRYDGMPGDFVWHEAISFRDDRGYDLSSMAERAKASISRAFGLEPVGVEGKAQVYRDFGQGRFAMPGGRGFIPTDLPRFDAGAALEIIVRIKPA